MLFLLGPPQAGCLLHLPALRQFTPPPLYFPHLHFAHAAPPSPLLPLRHSHRFARKLYDIMLLNTSPSPLPLPLPPADPGKTAAAAAAAGARGGTSKGGVAGGGANSSSVPAASPPVWAWSTPDRTPHAWQWLWDSCFHALGMNPINHTLAWEQLKVGCRERCAYGWVEAMKMYIKWSYAT